MPIDREQLKANFNESWKENCNFRPEIAPSETIYKNENYQKEKIKIHLVYFTILFKMLWKLWLEDSQ